MAANDHLRRLDIRLKAGEVFEASDIVDNTAVIWSGLFSEQERRLLKTDMREQSILFSLRDNFEIVVRCVWQPTAKDRLLKLRKGHTAVLLHDMQGSCANGWCWGKLVRPLYQWGFSVVMLEWPGFGNSRFNSNRAEAKDWQRMDGDIVLHVLSELGVGQFHIVAHGRGCETAMRIMQICPQRLEKTMFFHNPSVDITRFFSRQRALSERRITAEDWNRIAWDEATLQTATLFREEGFAVLATFEEDSQLSAKCLATKQVLLACKAVSIFLDRSLILETATAKDVTECQLGANCPLRFLFLSKRLRRVVPAFLRDCASVTCLDDAESLARTESLAWTSDLRKTWNMSSATRLSQPRRSGKSFGGSFSSFASESMRSETSALGFSRASTTQMTERPSDNSAVDVYSPPGTAPSPNSRSKQRKKSMQRPASEGTLRPMDANPFSLRPPEATIAGALRLAQGELYSDPKAMRKAIISRVPGDLMRRLDVEYNQLEDGCDAPGLNYNAEAKQAKVVSGGTLGRLKNKRDTGAGRSPELTKTQTLVQDMNKAFKEAETNYLTQNPRKLFGIRLATR